MNQAMALESSDGSRSDDSTAFHRQVNDRLASKVQHGQQLFFFCVCWSDEIFAGITCL